MHALPLALGQLLVLVLVGVVQLLMPQLTRADLWFAVTVDPSFRATPEARRIERRYRLQTLVHLLLGLALAAWGLVQGVAWLFPAGLVWMLLGNTAAFLAARRQARPFAVEPSRVREALLVRPHDEMPGGLPAQLGPFVLLALVAALLLLRWDALPEQVPTHFDAAGRPDAWASRSVGSIFGPLLAGAALCGLLSLIPLALRRARRVHATGPQGASENAFRRATFGVTLASEYLVAITFSLLTFVTVGGPRWILSLLPVLPLVLVVWIVVRLARVGQGGSRLAAPVPDGAPAGDRTSDRTWKAGLLYVNRDDPALFVEKRFGIGFTLNFGHPWALPLLLGVLAAPFLVHLIVRLVS